jgi:hypothetical protein
MGRRVGVVKSDSVTAEVFLTAVSFGGPVGTAVGPTAAP